MKKTITLFFASLLSSLSFAAGGGDIHLDKYPGDITNEASLQSGAKYFFNYCYACHSIEYGRYNRIAKDLNIGDELFEEYLKDIDSQKIGELMVNSMDKDDAKAWFGATPPDLTMVARVRGNDWLYTYLRGFYKDDSRPWGVNNVVFKDVGMPHVQLELQGLCAHKPESDEVFDKLTGQVIKGGCNEFAIEGSMSPKEFDQATEDLVNFLSYMGEPVQLERQRLGKWVIGFLLILLVLSYMLYKDLWRDVKK